MKKEIQNLIDIEIDKLTNSIENSFTGEIFETEIIQLTIRDLKHIIKVDWQFDWHKEIRDKTKTIYRLNTINNPDIIQGLLSIEDKSDHIFMHLIESAKFNRGKNKIYFGVPANLVAFACKISFEKGYDGFVAFDSKSALIKHYEESLGATHFRGLRMFIEIDAAIKLVNRYFKNRTI
jgi:hypothetical protein